MSKFLSKVVWAYKLLRSQSYVVLTDKESGMSFEGYSPEKFESALALVGQRAALTEFVDGMKGLQIRHDIAIDELLAKENESGPKKSARKQSDKSFAQGSDGVDK